MHFTYASLQTQGGTWTRTASAALSGHNDAKAYGTVDDCKAACIDRPFCKSFDYDKDQRSCDLSDSSAGRDGVASLRTDYPGNPYDHYDSCGTTFYPKDNKLTFEEFARFHEYEPSFWYEWEELRSLDTNKDDQVAARLLLAQPQPPQPPPPPPPPYCCAAAVLRCCRCPRLSWRKGFGYQKGRRLSQRLVGCGLMSLCILSNVSQLSDKAVSQKAPTSVSMHSVNCQSTLQENSQLSLGFLTAIFSLGLRLWQVMQHARETRSQKIYPNSEI